MKLFAFAFSLIVATGCAADRDAQDFQNDQALRDIARVNEIAGKYSGRLMGADGQLIGLMTVDLRANPEITTGGSGQIGAGLKTVVTIQTDRSVTVSLDSGYYDWRTRTFKAAKEIVIDGGTNYDTEISGSFEDKDRTLRGELGIGQFPEATASFVLKRDRKFRPEETPGEDPDELAPGETWIYEGKFGEQANCSDRRRESNCMDLRMALQSDSNSRLQEFVELLAPVKYVNVTIGFPGFAVIFMNSYWDLTNNELSGVTTFGEYQIRLTCSSEDEATYWTCDYFKTNTTSTTRFTVERVRD
jgi:hypothetical protein